MGLIRVPESLHVTLLLEYEFYAISMVNRVWQIEVLTPLRALPLWEHFGYVFDPEVLRFLVSLRFLRN
jgi:hypothetical protein